MSIIYTDAKIDDLISERKPLPANWRARFRSRSKRGHEEGQLELVGDMGNKFRLIARKSQINSLDFSLILAVRVPKSSKTFRLRRYNGKSHHHTNRIENQTFYGFHIHIATERYQERGGKEDTYAEETDRYSDFDGALNCLIHDTNLIAPLEAQRDIFAPGAGNVH